MSKLINKKNIIDKNKIYWKKIMKLKPKAKLCFIHIPKCGGPYAEQILKDLKIRNINNNNIIIN